MLQILRGKKIILGVTGSIAAYKAIYLLRRLVEANAEVFPVLTKNAERFVTPLTFSTLSGYQTITDLWPLAERGAVGHVEAAEASDLLVIAPLTADTLARLSGGRAEDPLSTIALALGARVPWVLAPAMETGMWQNALTQQNLAHLQSVRSQGRAGEEPKSSGRGSFTRVVEPDMGVLASGRIGQGRMAEPDLILQHIVAALTPQDLAGLKILLTAGPTREAFDPARFISNRSTGKMGLALAEVAALRGAEVEVVLGPTLLKRPAGVSSGGSGSIKYTEVETTASMLTACEQKMAAADILIMAAAPVDFKPQFYSAQKVKKSQVAGQEISDLSALTQTVDILGALLPRLHRKFVVGFAAESEQLRTFAQDKLKRKNLQIVVANDISRTDAGFAVNNNEVQIIRADGVETFVPLQSKQRVASEILDHVVAMLADFQRR